MGVFLFLHFTHEPVLARFLIKLLRVIFSFQRIADKTGKGISQPDARLSLIARAPHFSDPDVELS